MGKCTDIWNKIKKHHEDELRMHAEFHRQHTLRKFYTHSFKDHMQSHKQIEECENLHAEFHRQEYELRKRLREFRRSKSEFHKMHRHVRLSPFIILIFNLLIWYLIFKYAGIKTVSVIFATLMTLGGLFEFIFLRKIENRLLIPIDKLKNGVEEIAKGNYNVKIESNIQSEISLLIDSFNDMAQKLQESEKIKNEYEENRKNLIANISHDLKTPITSIQGYIEAITEGNAASSENINKYLKIIYNNTAYMNKLIDDLFLFSKLDMEKLEFQFVELSVKPFVSDLMEEFKIELEERNVQFEYIDNLDVECRFIIDRKRIHQVFKNIIGNALKYGPEQNLSIKAELNKKDGYARISIKDNGPGISEDKLPHIFERFYRIDTERTKDFISTGLGLAIAKELIESHKGIITASSKENEGTCFTIMIPVL
ncbi:MAG: HAMP domain-containing sensor histidine kinase [Bacillota bacterium]|nr:HAMP domain-containing sensor histidine kinase [Bacillota bacterium]